MVFRLIIDVVRRKWLMGLWAVFQLSVIFFHGARQFWPSLGAMPLTISGAWFLSTTAGELFSSRVLYQLPVSRRTWWLARWWMCVVLTVVIAQVASSIDQWQWQAGSAWFDVEPALLSMAFGILYCGVSMAGRTTSFGKWADAPGTFFSVVAIGPVMIGFVAAPFFLAPYLPHSFAELHAAWIVVMLVMAAVTAVGYRHHPAITPRPNARRVSPLLTGSTGSSATPRVEPTATGFFGRLTGTKMVLWEECRKQFFIFSAVIAIGVAWWAIGSQYRPWPALGEVLRKASMLPFSGSSIDFFEPIMFGLLFVIASFADVWMTSRIRSLRTLPVSSTKLAGLPVVLGLVSASMLWGVLLALHGLVLRTLPSSLRPDLFVAFAALTATAHTIRFVTPGQAPLKSMLGLVPFFVIFMAVAYIDDPREAVPSQFSLLMGGLLTLAASWLVMRLAVTRSSTMYRPRPAVG